MIETLLETPAQLKEDTDYSPAGTINALAAGNTAVVGTGTNFTTAGPSSTSLAANDILEITDATTGRVIYVTVASVTDATNLTLVENTVRDIAALSTWKKLDGGSPYFISGDSKTSGELPTKYRVYQDGNTSLKGQNSTSPLYINGDEGVLVKSIYVRMPYQYTLADTFLGVNFAYSSKTSPGTTNNIPQIGVNGFVNINIENTEIPVNAYVPPYDVLSSGIGLWNFKISIYNATVGQNTALATPEDLPMVSGINVPASLAQEMLPIVIGVRILHGNALVT